MNILILGSGGREHALAWKMAASPLRPSSTARRAMPASRRRPNAWRSISPTTSRADRLLPGEQDRFRRGRPRGAALRRPRRRSGSGRHQDLRAEQRAARLEGSKGFTKDLCKANKIPTAAYERFKGAAAAKDYVRKKGAPIVVKADGLAAGKGVVVAETVAEAEAAIDMMFGGGLRRARLGDRDRGMPRRRGSLVLRAVRRRNGHPACLGAGPQARLRRRQGAEYRRHGRLFAGADHDGRDEQARDGRDHHADGARHEGIWARPTRACCSPG